MRENEHQPGPPPALPPPGGPPPVDPEQVRQFQQFQQFQELMRQHGGIPPAPAPRPLWKRVLTSRTVRRLALLAIVLFGLYFAYDYYFGDDSENLPASVTGGGTNKTNVLHETTPKRTVRQVYSHIAQNDRAPNEYEFVCGQFENGAERQFAEDFGAPDCKAAVAKLHAQIDKSVPGWRNAYAEPFPGAELGEVPVGTVAVVSSCQVKFGPQLGEFTLRRIENDQWVITGHRPETC
ncbi:hypothetical protein [Actinophytocola sp.]|uniref:hypothetical protein n=1 Tax=Actinophytocola sp. TaxID=1872138 RepID=UPI002D809E45|nr:hypothetical protein [Actinophytocola sp.]HET9141084.1 hypothetical protein [Actinophytocola sp.]